MNEYVRDIIIVTIPVLLVMLHLHLVYRSLIKNYSLYDYGWTKAWIIGGTFMVFLLYLMFLGVYISYAIHGVN